MQATRRDSRVLLIGLDGFDPALAGRFMAAGGLPNLQRLRADCAEFPLEHGKHRFTGLAWEHVATGQSPERSGRWSAVEFDSRHYEVQQADTRAQPFTAGLPLRSVVVDPPYFDLLQADNTQGLTSWGGHDPGITLRASPSSLLQEVRDRFGDYSAEEFIYGITWPSVERTLRKGEALARAARQRGALARWLLTERMPDWELGFVVWSEFHSVIEPMWHGLDADHPLHALPSAVPSARGVEEVYRAADEAIGALVDSVPDARLVLFSMHGMGPNESDVPSMALLPELLHRLAFARSVLQPRAEWLAQAVPLLGAEESWERAVIDCLHHEALPRRERLQRGLRKRLRRRPAHARSLSWMPAAHYQRYWSRMDAFALPSFYDGQIRLNLVGREARGRVEAAEYDRVCDRIEAELRACSDPHTGAPAVGDITRLTLAQALEGNPSLGDLQVTWQGSLCALQHPRLGRIGPLPPRRTGGHTGGHGVAYVRAPGVSTGLHPLRSSFDVVPSVLALFGVDKPSEMSGESFL